MLITDVSSPITREAVRNLLSNNLIKVTFTKADGSTREMVCTTSEVLAPEAFPKLLTENTDPKPENIDVKRVYDVEAKGWRSFRWDSVTEISTL